MKSTIGSFLLVAGTIAASLAAASGERPWVAVALDDVALDDPDVVLFDELVSGAAGTAAATTVPAGSAVTLGVIEGLRAQGAEEIRIRRLAQADERVPVGDAASIEGRILAQDLYYDDASGERVERAEAELRLERAAELLEFVGEQDTIEVARPLAVAGALQRDEVIELPVSGDGSDWELIAVERPVGSMDESSPEAAAGAAADDGAPATERTLEAWQGAPDFVEVVATRADLDALRSSALISGVPAMRKLAPAGRFVDADLAGRIVEYGFAELDVRVPKPAWDWREWTAMPVFVGGLLAMIIGVVLTRSARTASALAAAESAAAGDELTPREALARIVDRVEDLSAGGVAIERSVLLASIDGLLGNEIFTFGEAKDQLRAELGGRNYAKVMAAFSTGERRLSRAWSAAADGYDDEAAASLSECVEPFREAAEALGGKPAVERTDEGAEYTVWKSGDGN